MDYIRTDADGQLTLTQSTDFLMIPSCLYGFVNESTSTGRSASGRTVIRFSGSLQADNEDLTCRCCGTKMHVNNHPGITLRHLPFGGYLSDVSFTRTQYICPECRNTRIPIRYSEQASYLLIGGFPSSGPIADMYPAGSKVILFGGKQDIRRGYCSVFDPLGIRLGLREIPAGHPYHTAGNGRRLYL